LRSIKFGNLDLTPFFPQSIRIDLYLQKSACVSLPDDLTNESYKKVVKGVSIGEYDGYKSKYPDVTIDDLWKRLNTMMDTNLNVGSPKDLAELVNSTLKAEVKLSEKEMARKRAQKKKKEKVQFKVPFIAENEVKGIRPNLFTTDAEGNHTFDWSAISGNFARAKVNEDLINALKDDTFQMDLYGEVFAKIKHSNFHFDWAKLEKSLGPNAALALRKEMLENENSIEKFDYVGYLKSEREHYTPLLEAIKDQFNEGLEYLEAGHKYVVQRAPIYQKDSYDLPYKFRSFDYLDNYETHFRDWLIFQVEKQKWQIKPRSVFKNIPVKTYDDLALTISHKFIDEADTKLESKSLESQMESGEIEIVDVKETHLQGLLKSINDQSIILKDVTTKVVELRQLWEQKAAARKKKALLSGEKKVEAKREILLSDEQWAIEIGRIKKEDEEHEKWQEDTLGRLQARKTIF